MNNASLKFLGAFVRNPRRVGAIMPSSPSLARAMVRRLSVQPGETLIELGPGTGAFTEVILRHLPAGAHYLGVELSAAFVSRLRERFPGVDFVEGSAEDVAEIHAQRGLPATRAVLCGLPFASLPREVQGRVVTSLDALLQGGGEFRTFQYVHAYPLPTARRYRARMDGVFGPGRRGKAVARNIPPAYVLSWSRAAGT